MNTTVIVRFKGEVRVRFDGEGPSSEFHWQLEELAKDNGLTVTRIEITQENLGGKK